MDERRAKFRNTTMKGRAGTGWRQELDRPAADREALVFEGRTLSFAELGDEVDGFGQELDAHGLSTGTRVGLLAPPSVEGVALIHALLDRGIVMVPMNLRWTRDELRFALESAGIDWLVIADASESLATDLAQQAGCGILRLVGSTTRTGVVTPIQPRFERMRAPAPEKLGRPRLRRDSELPDDAALLLFTSGTSGRPKAALLTLGNLRASAEASIAHLGSQPNDRWLCCMPLFHIGGLSILIRGALAGTSVVLHPGFDAERVNRALDEERISRVSLVAAMLMRLLDVRGNARAPDGLRLVLLGGGPASQELLGRAHALGYPLAPTYGLTEAASQVATRPPGRSLTAGADGRVDLAAGLEPLPGTEIRIVDTDGKPVASPAVGEIEVRGPTVMQGYWGDPEATARAFREGWLATGDIGNVDAMGGLRVLDRRSDLIVSGGENVYPAEVESVLVQHPSIVEAGVVGIPDVAYGERPRAYVVVAEGHDLDLGDVLEFCRDRLARYKWPDELVLLDTLPRTASGKLLRRELNAIEGAREGSSKLA